ncbi:DUF7665 family protein [Pseudonocardia saturnea]
MRICPRTSPSAPTSTRASTRSPSTSSTASARRAERPVTESVTRPPGEIRLRADLAGPGFHAGVHAGLWRNPAVDWPALTVEIAVGDDEFASLRLAVDGYPARAPGGQLWDQENDRALPPGQWPRGGTAEKVFRLDWSVPNGGAPYLPCDRTGLSTHPDWAAAHPERSWNPSRSITFYLDEIARELQDAHLPDQAVTA